MKERTGGNKSGGGEDDVVCNTKSKNDVQSVGLHIVLITFVDKLGVCLAERIVFCLIRHLIYFNLNSVKPIRLLLAYRLTR